MDAFRAMGDPLRRSLLGALAEGPARVVDLTRGRGISRPAVSRHLALLLDAGCVSATPQGRETWYALTPDGLAPVRAFLDQLYAPAKPAAGVRPPIDEVRLTGLDLEIRRTVRHDEREGGAAPASSKSDDAREASA